MEGCGRGRGVGCKEGSKRDRTRGYDRGIKEMEEKKRDKVNREGRKNVRIG
jgi:hypothetical protein